MGKATTSGPPQEITITFASLQAPKISRGPQQLTEEPFAFEAREFLRKTCIGKTVVFSIIYCVTSFNRTFGDVCLVSPENGESINLAKLVVEAGWSVVKEFREDKSSCIHDELVGAEAVAKRANIGVHTDNAKAKTASVRQLTWQPTTANIEV